MTVALLESHPDLVTRLDTPAGHCDATVVVRWLGSSWACGRPAWWRVTGHPAACGQHSARTLRRLLLDGDGSGS